MLSHLLPAVLEERSNHVTCNDMNDVNNKDVFHLELRDVSASPISSEEGKASSLASDSRASSDVTIVTPEETSSAATGGGRTNKKPNGHITHKPPGLKRVSFGSSKGSMVETLIFESPVIEEEEPGIPLPIGHTHINGGVHLTNGPTGEHDEDDDTVSPLQDCESASRKRVRVTFLEGQRPSLLTSPEPWELEEATQLALMDAERAIAVEGTTPQHLYIRQGSTESGWDNPFRPDGDLSKEADEIVEAIKGGRPISTAMMSPSTPTKDFIDHAPATEPTLNKTTVSTIKSTPTSNDTTSGKSGGGANGAVEVQLSTTAQPTDSSQVEHVVLPKKKPKCKCCVIQ